MPVEYEVEADGVESLPLEFMDGLGLETWSGKNAVPEVRPYPKDSSAPFHRFIFSFGICSSLGFKISFSSPLPGSHQAMLANGRRIIRAGGE